MTKKQPVKLTPGQYGFAWGPINVVRGMEHEGAVSLLIETEAGKKIQVYASRTGRSLRVFQHGGKEMKADG